LGLPEAALRDLLMGRFDEVEPELRTISTGDAKWPRQQKHSNPNYNINIMQPTCSKSMA